MGRTVAVIQARLGSTRLPGKVLMDICGAPMLQRVYERVKQARLVDRVIVATDPEMVRLIPDVCYYVGSAEDVLDRVYRAARFLEADAVVRVTADCPLIDPPMIDAVIELLRTEGAEYASNILPDDSQDGTDVEVMTMLALERAQAQATTPHDREHVTPWMRRHAERQALYTGGPRDLLSVDTLEDLERVRRIYERLLACGGNIQ